MIRNRKFWIATGLVAAAALWGIGVRWTTAAKPGTRAKAAGSAGSGGPGITIDARGLRSDSPRTFAVYRGSRCVKIGRIGQRTQVPPGRYDVRVGFPSGWVSCPVTLRAGQKLTVPTGLFRFRNMTGPGRPSTIPQKLYHGETYLATGYQGMTARLLPGAYTVRYHAPGDVKPARGLREWHIIGPFPANPKKDRDMARPYPPEQSKTLDFAQPVTIGKRKYVWRRINGPLEMDLRYGLKYGGFVYLATTIDSPSQRRGQLTFGYRAGLKAWLDGRLVRTIPAAAKLYITRRAEMPVTLRKGANVLLVKTYASQYSYWPFSAVMESWRSYEVTVRAGSPGAPGPESPASAEAAALPPVEGIRGIVFCQVPNLPNGRSGLHPEQFRIVRRPRKARLCTLIPATPNGTLTDLTSRHFVAAMQPDINYEATRVVFTARKLNKPGDKWNIYEMSLPDRQAGLDGGGLRQITRNLGDCFDPCYLPGGRILFSSTANSNFRDEYDRDIPPLLHTCNPDGGDVEQITFNLSSDMASVVLNDGRILFTSWQHHGEHVSTAGVFAFFTINPDGTNFMAFFGNHREANNSKSYAQQLTDGRVVFVDSAGHRHYNAGGLSAIYPRKPLSTRRILTPGMVYNGHNLAGRYASPYPLPDGAMICSYSPGRGTSLLTGDPSEEIHLGIYRFDFQSGRPGRIIFDDPYAQDYDAIAIYPRPEPPALQRTARPRGQDGPKTGRMLCVNAYLNDRPRQEKRVVVGELPPARPGEIKAVRVVEGFGVKDTDRNRHRPIVIDMLQMTFGSSSNGGNAFEQKRIVGYAPAYEDGSFHIEVPADTVLSLQTLDKNGMAIDTQLTWTWVRPGENRMCVGCHENREMALPNFDCIAMRRPPSFVARAQDKRRTVDFRRDIMPIIEARCSRCHHGREDTAGGLDLRKGFELVFHRTGYRGRKIEAALFNHAYESLLQAPPNRVGTLVISNSARYSPLIWRLYGKQLAFTDQRNPYKKKSNRMPPKKPLTDAEKKLFVEWIDIGAQWDNILGTDDLPGYDAKQSRAMAIEARKRLAAAITDPRKAFEARCLECHDMRKIAPMKKMSAPDIAPMVHRMSAKRRGWIHTEEIPLILQHINTLRTPVKKPAPKKPGPKPAPKKK